MNGEKSQDETRPRVSVIVPVHDDADRLARCLQALKASATDDFDIWVVDDASPNDASIRIAEAAGVNVLKQTVNTGPAGARNAGAQAASGDIVFFVDADCLVHSDAVSRVIHDLASDSPYAAVFGSYGPDPAHPAFISRWKNLAHRHTHQVAHEEAGTFWSGCGAMRRDRFHEFGGFDKTFGRPCIEDIELGMRLRAAGHRVLLDKQLQVEHLKRWRLGNLIKTDIFDRGVPWTRVLLAMSSEGNRLDDLNVGKSQKIAALAAAGVVGILLLGGIWRPWLLMIPIIAVLAILLVDGITARGMRWAWLLPATVIAALLGIAVSAWYAPIWIAAAGTLAAMVIAINWSFYRVLANRESVGFAVAGFVPHVIYYLCALTGYALGVASHLIRPRKPSPMAGPANNENALSISQ